MEYIITRRYGHVLQQTIHKIFVVTSLFYLTSCNGQASKEYAQSKQQVLDSTAYKWTQLTGKLAFPKAYNFQLLSLRDT